MRVSHEDRIDSTAGIAMHDSTSHNASPELVAAWLDRYRKLSALITQHPRDPSQWIWHVWHKTLAYLLSRYGSNVSASDLMETPSSEPSPLDGGELLSKERMGGIEMAHYSDAPPRDAGKFRESLERIGGHNEDRHAAAEREREEVRIQYQRRLAEIRQLRLLRQIEQTMKRWQATRALNTIRMTYPENGFTLPNETLAKEERELMLREIESIQGLMPNDSHLSEEEILAILTGEAP